MNGESGPGYNTGNASEMGDEPGAVENRLSLSPNDERWSDTVGEWQDGKKYTITVEVQQISPGEFEVLNATPESQPSDSEEASEPAPSKSDYPNPAVANLMASAKR